jgi:sporulation protein YlmC with PRC-barrel domain
MRTPVRLAPKMVADSRVSTLTGQKELRMEQQMKKGYTITNPTEIKRRKPLSVILSVLVALTLVLGACGGDTDGEPPVDETPVGQEQGIATPTSDEALDAEDSDAVTETVTAGEDITSGVEAEDVSVITSTELITGTEVTTDITVTTDTTVIEQQQITTVITATDIVTDAVESTETSTITESEVITETGTVTSDTTTDAGEAEVGATPAPTGTTTVTGTQGVTGTSGATAAAGAFTGIEGSTGRSMLASTLLDANFETIDGEVGGEIQDIVVDVQSGQVLYVLLEFGGFLDIGDTDMPVPLSAFRWGDEDQMILNIDGQQLEGFPGVGNDWPVPDTDDWDVDVRGFWEGIGVDTGFDAPQAMPGVRRVSNLIGAPVADAGFGEGRVDDLIIALDEGRARYVLISYAGTELGDEWFVVPFSAFDPTPPEAGLRLNADFTPDLLEQAPRFNAADFDDTRVFDEGFDNDWRTYWDDAGYPLSNAND